MAALLRGIKRAIIPVVTPVVDALAPFKDEKLFDLVNGIETSTRLEPQHFQTAAGTKEFAKRYQPAPTSKVRRALKVLARHDPAVKDLDFVDFGAGKGKVCTIAARFGFRHIVGVEFERSLVEAANRNLDRALGPDRRARTAMVYADVLDYRLPSVGIVAFFFNPFTGAVMRPVVERLRAHAAAGVPVYVIYIRALHIDLFAEGWQTLDADPREHVRSYVLRASP